MTDLQKLNRERRASIGANLPLGVALVALDAGGKEQAAQ